MDGDYTTNIKVTTYLFNIKLFLTVIENTFYTGFGLQKYFLSQIALMTSLSNKRTAKNWIYELYTWMITLNIMLVFILIITLFYSINIIYKKVLYVCVKRYFQTIIIANWNFRDVKVCIKNKMGVHYYLPIEGFLL